MNDMAIFFPFGICCCHMKYFPNTFDMLHTNDNRLHAACSTLAFFSQFVTKIHSINDHIITNAIDSTDKKNLNLFYAHCQFPGKTSEWTGARWPDRSCIRTFNDFVENSHSDWHNENRGMGKNNQTCRHSIWCIKMVHRTSSISIWYLFCWCLSICVFRIRSIFFSFYSVVTEITVTTNKTMFINWLSHTHTAYVHSCFSVLSGIVSFDAAATMQFNCFSWFFVVVIAAAEMYLVLIHQSTNELRNLYGGHSIEIKIIFYIRLLWAGKYHFVDFHANWPKVEF